MKSTNEAREARLRSLLIAAQGGDARSYSDFLRELASVLRAFFRRRLISLPDEVEDLVQETLLAVHNKRHTYEPEQPVTAWLFAIARLFSEAERASFEFALAAASVPNAVTPELMAQLRAHWDEGEIVEIVGVIGLFGFLNRWNDSMATTLEPAAGAVAQEHLGRRGWSPGKHV